MDMGGGTDKSADQPLPDDQYPPTYFNHSEHRGVLLTHISLMVLGWVVMLPLGELSMGNTQVFLAWFWTHWLTSHMTATMFSLARSRYTLPTQFVFLATNALGVIFGTIYNANTPDLYPNNAHHKLGWLATWVLCAHGVVSLLGRFAGAFEKYSRNTRADAAERQGFLPVSQAALNEHRRFHKPCSSPLSRDSNDSGQGTEPETESLRSHSFSSSPDPLANLMADSPVHKEFDDEDGDEDLETDVPTMPRGGAIRNFVTRVGGKISSRAWSVIILWYKFVDRTGMILGFITLCTGIVTYGRLFEGNGIFSGLAHWIKGSVFLWHGIFTLGRWSGSFGELGWVSVTARQSGVVTIGTVN